MSGEKGTKTVELAIDGMHCERCAKNVETSFSGIDGIESIEVRIGSLVAEIFPQIIDEADIERIVRNAGYEVRKPETGKGSWKRFLGRLIKSNEESFGIHGLDCCSLNIEQDKKRSI